MSRYLFLIVFLFSSRDVYSQTCAITVSSTRICVGSSVLLGVTVTGGTPVSYQWVFGDGYTGTSASPSYNYLAVGSYIPKVTVKFSNGSTCLATAATPIKVLELPVAKFTITSDDTMCFRGNKLCITDQSAAGPSSAPISKRILQLSNGYIQTEQAPYSNSICYENKTDLMGHRYSLVLEVSDTNKCVARMEKKDAVVLYPALPTVSFTASFLPKCSTTTVTIRNTSKIDTANIARFYWDYGDGKKDSTNWNPGPHNYTIKGSLQPSLKVIDKNGCMDTQSVSFYVLDKPLDSTIQIHAYNKCIKGNAFAFTSKYEGNAIVDWRALDANGAIIKFFTSSTPTDSFKMTFPYCGPYSINMRIQGGGCKAETDTFISVYGPKATIEEGIYQVVNKAQCEISDTVSFTRPGKFFSCVYGNGSLSYLWDFDDAFAPPCTTDTRNGINVGVNCNFSRDSFNVKHAYTKGQEKCYTARLTMTDPVLGCTSKDSTTLRLTPPSAHPDPSAVPPRRGLYFIGNPCIDVPVIFGLDETLPKCGYEAAWINYDSACGKDNWELADTIRSKYIFHTYTSTCDKEGYVTVGLIIKNGLGNDCYDTAWFHHMFRATPINPKYTIQIPPGCAPNRVEFIPDDGTQYNIKYARWFFGDGPLATVDQNMLITDSIVHTQSYEYLKPGVYRTNTIFTNHLGCSMSDNKEIALGYNTAFSVPDTSICAGDSVIITDEIGYFNSTIDYWSDPSREAAGLEKISWNIGDGTGYSIKGRNPRFVYKKGGRYSISVALQDSLGCRDTNTIVDYIDVTEVVSHIGFVQTEYYCAPQIIQFTDSSYIIYLDSFPDDSLIDDSIIITRWDFGDNKQPSTLQNPAHSFTSNGKFKTMLTVTTAKGGCTDTTSVLIDLKGPQPSFDITSDTFGCTPYTVVLRNTTGKQLQGWIWYFNDPDNSIHPSANDSDVTFTYTKAGTYNIRLLGTEDIFNPSTGNVTSCNAFFPDTTIEANTRQVYVLNTPPAQVFTADTVCAHAEVKFTAVVDSLYIGFRWSFGDGDIVTLSKPDSVVTHVYKDPGRYYPVMMVPRGPADLLCIDTVEAGIYTADIEADFDIESNGALGYRFYNKSKFAKRYLWDFGKPMAGAANTSKEKDPVFTYKAEAGMFMVCLMAFNEDDCWDSVCKPVMPNPRLVIPNAFSPGNNDGKNDVYDIDAIGLQEYHLLIYNRWGVEVFEGKNDGVGNDGTNWNGRNHNDGAECPSGAYYYIFIYKGAGEDKEQTVRGVITLVRDK